MSLIIGSALRRPLTSAGPIDHIWDLDELLAAP
jgi:hypothetical protein